MAKVAVGDGFARLNLERMAIMSTIMKKREPVGALTRRTGDDVGFASLNRLRNEFDNLWSEFFTGMPALWNADRADHHWAFDVEDQEDAYLIKAEAPGFDAADFEIDLRGEMLVMQAAKTAKKQGKDEESFSACEFYHALTIPPYVDGHHIMAEYKQGLLTVTLPKTAEGKGRKIPVKG